MRQLASDEGNSYHRVNKLGLYSLYDSYMYEKYRPIGWDIDIDALAVLSDLTW